MKSDYLKIIQILSKNPQKEKKALPVGSLGHTSGSDCTGRICFVGSTSFLKKTSLLLPWGTGEELWLEAIA